MRRLPPLTALRAFEVVGRTGNVRAAAQELNVTPAAVSHQIRLLEEHVGLELFVRSGRGLVLTPAGQQYLRRVSNAFDELAQASKSIPGARAQTLRVHSLPSFASCWLVPRLARFYHAHTGIEVEIETVGDPAQPPDLAGLGADFAIRVGLSDTQWPGLKVEKLVHEEMFPVCSPELMAERPLRTPDDLASHTLLQVSRRAEGWPEWFAAARDRCLARAAIDPTHGPKFDTIQLATAAAIEGMGVAMGRLPLIEDYLKDGALVAPFSLRVRSRNAYWLLSPLNATLSPEAEIFRSWMLEELALPAAH